ncbi:MAG: hypothetical protein K8R89_09575 [Anaerolineae bacterium]|nr:hypothetical protein [Anaerolineae bacterium]
MDPYTDRGEPILKLNLPEDWREWKRFLDRDMGLTGLRVVRRGWDNFERWYVIETVDRHAHVFRVRVLRSASPEEVVAAAWQRRGWLGWSQEVVTC